MATPLKQQNFGRKTFEPLDHLDRRLIAELQGNPRLPVAQLGRRVGLSPPAIAERMRRLEESGVLSYRAEVDPRALGYGICAIVRVSPQTGELQAIPAIAREIPEITECYRITGEDCYFMKLYLRDIEDLEPILDRFAPHGRTTTSIVHSASVALRPLPVLEQYE
ncbi:MAG TPA: Lrp/AsnC family transcriptional regulator [Rhodanobacteraceae bacterium]|nr:Lrp/AsnC family transcriptional regulator [Rhodanobacteraceae bacterium]